MKLAPRMTSWLLVSAAFLVVDLLLSAQAVMGVPDPMHVAVHKADLVSIGAWLGYWIDRASSPYGRPGEYFVPGHHIIGATLMVRRALIIAACVLAMGLGL